jgi:hypothetical protein
LTTEHVDRVLHRDRRPIEEGEMREGIGSACCAELTRKADHHHTRQQELQVLCSGYYNSTQISQISMHAWQSQFWSSIKLWHGNVIKKVVILEFQKLPLLAENVYRILFLLSHFSYWALFTYQN